MPASHPPGSGRLRSARSQVCLPPGTPAASGRGTIFRLDRGGAAPESKSRFPPIADLEAALARIDYPLRPLDILLLHTGADKRLGSPDYFRQPGLGREGVLWLVGQGVKVIGIDACIPPSAARRWSPTGTARRLRWTAAVSARRRPDAAPGWWLPFITAPR
jgi:hypothetical protein